MKRPYIFILLALVISSTLSAGELAYLDKLPPMIDREIFFGDPEISGAKISPNGKFISFRKPYLDVMNIWVKGVNEPFEKARPVTADTTRPVRGYFWSVDSRYILYVQDKGGNENFHIYAVDPMGKPSGELDVPTARDLTPMDSVRAAIYSLPENNPDIIYIGLNDRDRRYHDVYRLKISTGKTELIRKNTEEMAVWVFDQQGNLRLSTRKTSDGGTEIFRIDDDGFTPIYECGNRESAAPTAFHEDGKRFYMITNKGEDADLTRLVLFDPATLEEELVESDPEGEVDFGGAIFSEKTDELVATYYVGDRLRVYFKDYDFKWAYKRLKNKLPDGDLYFGSMTSDDRYWIVAVTRDTDPGARYLYDMERDNLAFLYRSRPELPVEHLASMKPITYQSRDGLAIHAYLTLPKNVDPENLAVVVNPHGGPWARDYWGYNSEAQFLANRGYAVLQINFRGSSGYGKDFLNAGKKEWGDAMQDDITDGVNYLIEKGIADPGKIAIYGGSYGGYATLAGLAFTPDLYAAGVDYVGVSNIITLLKSIPPYWESMRSFFNEHVGDPDDPEDTKRMRRQSPLFSAEKIEAPLLVVQGANDPRVKKAESDQIVVAMRDLDRDVKYIVAPDEGHGFAGEKNRMAFIVAMEKFLAAHLGGRFQESIDPEVEKRLDEITVPVKSVTMPELPAGYEEARSAGMPELDPSAIEAVELDYKVTASAAGREIELNANRKIEEAEVEGAPVWKVTTEQKSPMGTAVEKASLFRETLLPVSSEINQGPAKIVIEYTDKAVSGTIYMRGNEIPMETKLDAPIMGTNSAIEVVFPALPLKEGYQTTYRVFDIMTQSVKIYSLKVEGTEEVTVPAGTFDAFRVVVKPMEEGPGGGTYMIRTDKPRVVVKADFQLPAASGGGDATMVLEAVR